MVVIPSPHSCIMWLTRWKSVICFEVPSFKRLPTWDLFTWTWVPFNNNNKKIFCILLVIFFQLMKCHCTSIGFWDYHTFSLMHHWEGRAWRSWHTGFLFQGIRQESHCQLLWRLFEMLPLSCIRSRNNELRLLSS